MPVTKVEAPDGSIISVEHPEGANQQSILQFAQREYQNRQFAAGLNAPEPETAPEPKGGTVADALGQGVFFGFGDELAGVTGAGVNSIANLFGKGTGDSFGEAYRGIRDVARSRHEAFAERNPGTALAAEIGGGLLTGGVGAARAGAFQAAKAAPTLLGRVKPIAATGAVQGGLFGAGASEADNPRDVARDSLVGAAIGGGSAAVLPILAGKTRDVAKRVFQTASDSPAFREAVDLLKRKTGIETLTTGQATGSRPLRSAETTVSETVFGSAIGNRLEQNRRKFQSAVLRMAGFDPQDVTTGEISTSAIERASQRFSDRYKKLLEGKTVDLSTDEFLDDLAGIEGRHLQFLPFEQRRQIKDIVNQFIDEAAGAPLTGTAYQRIRSSLGALERQTANNPKIAALYRDLKHALDDAFSEQSGAGAQKKILDREYNRFAKLRDSFEGSGSIQTSSGDIPLPALLRRTSKRGKGTDKEFNDLLRAGQTVLGDPVANSGTPSRIANLVFLGQGLGSASLGGLDAGLTSIGLPIGASNLLSRGVTGSGGIDKLIQSGLLTAPATVPIFGGFEKAP